MIPVVAVVLLIISSWETWVRGFAAICHHCGELLLALPLLEAGTRNTPSAGTFIHVCRSVPGICLCLQQLLQTVSSRAQGPTCGLQTMLSCHVHISSTAFLCGTHIPITVPVRLVCTRVYYQLMSK